jgi:hypothetical protein
VAPATDAISKKEYEAMLWLKDNSPQDAVILCDKAVAGSFNRYFYASTFSERQAYLEGWYYSQMAESEKQRRIALVAKVYQNDPDALETITTEGISYIIKTNSLSPKFKLPADYGKQVFSNEEVTIYQLFV